MGMRQWEICPNNNIGKKAQALVELAVFGSIVLMLLGVLISYGLRYEHQQKTTQQAFRRALKSASDANASADDTPILVEHLVVNDMHVPDPSNTFGIGLTSSSVASTSVTRNNKLFKSPVDDKGLPIVRIEINGGQPNDFKTAGLLYVVVQDTEEAIAAQEAKYVLVYGANNVDPTTTGCGKFEPEETTDAEYDTQPACIEPIVQFKIVDSCAGEIINYSTALNRCKMITDEDFCAKECTKDCPLTQGSGAPNATCKTNCETTCQAEIAEPPYCAQLGALFPLGINSPMGLQSAYTERVTWQDGQSGVGTSLNKQETNAGITTTDNINWNTRIIRTIRSTNGPQEVISDVSQKKTSTWQAPW